MPKAREPEMKSASEIALDQQAYTTWVLSDREDNSEDRRVEKAMLMHIIQEQLTDRQREYLIEFYVNGKNQYEIAEKRGINHTSVSRVMNRALDKIHTHLKYVNPRCENEYLLPKGGHLRKHIVNNTPLIIAKTQNYFWR